MVLVATPAWLIPPKISLSANFIVGWETIPRPYKGVIPLWNLLIPLTKEDEGNLASLMGRRRRMGVSPQSSIFWSTPRKISGKRSRILLSGPLKADLG